MDRGRTSTEWAEYQQTCVREWINQQLKVCEIEVKDIFCELKDGSVIQKLVQVLCGEQPTKDDTTEKEKEKEKVEEENNSKTSKKPSPSFAVFKKNTNIQSNFKTMRQKESLNKSLQKLKSLGLDIRDISASDIMAGNNKVILALLWNIFRYSEDKSSKPDQLEKQNKAKKSDDRNKAMFFSRPGSEIKKERSKSTGPAPDQQATSNNFSDLLKKLVDGKKSLRVSQSMSDDKDGEKQIDSETEKQRGEDLERKRKEEEQKKTRREITTRETGREETRRREKTRNKETGREAKEGRKEETRRR